MPEHYVRIVPNGHVDYLTPYQTIRLHQQTQLRRQHRDTPMADLSLRLWVAFVTACVGIVVMSAIGFAKIADFVLSHLPRPA
jgi:hypothetical protein